MRWSRVVLRGHPVIETRVARLRLLGTVEGGVAVPLACHTCRIAGTLQQVSNRDLVLFHVDLFTSVRSRLRARRDPVIHAGSIGAASGQQAHSRWRTHRRRRIEVCETDAFVRQSIDVRRLDVRMTVNAKIAIAKVIAEDDDYVGAIFR